MNDNWKNSSSTTYSLVDLIDIDVTRFDYLRRGLVNELWRIESDGIPIISYE